MDLSWFHKCSRLTRSLFNVRRSRHVFHCVPTITFYQIYKKWEKQAEGRITWQSSCFLSTGASTSWNWMNHQNARWVTWIQFDTEIFRWCETVWTNTSWFVRGARAWQLNATMENILLEYIGAGTTQTEMLFTPPRCNLLVSIVQNPRKLSKTANGFLPVGFECQCMLCFFEVNPLQQLETL